MVAASSFGAVVQLVLVLTSGFTIVRSSIPAWWRWAYWLSPYSYAVRRGLCVCWGKEEGERGAALRGGRGGRVCRSAAASRRTAAPPTP